jgi:hypothetical protein
MIRRGGMNPPADLEAELMDTFSVLQVWAGPRAIRTVSRESGENDTVRLAAIDSLLRNPPGAPFWLAGRGGISDDRFMHLLHFGSVSRMNSSR